MTTDIEKILERFCKKYLTNHSPYWSEEHQTYKNNHNDTLEFFEAPGHKDLAPDVLDWLKQQLTAFEELSRKKGYEDGWNDGFEEGIGIDS